MPGKPWIPKFIRELLDNVDVTTDGTLASNSDSLLPSEKAVKTYVDNHSAGIPDAPSNGKIYVRRNGAWEELVIS